MTPITRIVLVHGAATTARIWDKVTPFLGKYDVVVPQRPMTGVLDDELAFLEPLCRGAVVVGVSGGATLGLALAAHGVPLSAAVLHEPAAGSLVPGLLDSVAAAYRNGGVEGFGSALYGSAWSLADAPADPAAVARDLTMFRAFEPAAPAVGAGQVLLTVGGDSPPVRQEVHQVLTERLGVEGRSLPGARHAVHLEAPRAFAAVVLSAVSRAAAPGR